MAHSTSKKHRHLTAATAWKAGYTAPTLRKNTAKKHPCRQAFKQPKQPK